nr:MAG: SH3 domain-containing protein [Chloroflexota bacterium]
MEHQENKPKDEKDGDPPRVGGVPPSPAPSPRQPPATPDRRASASVATAAQRERIATLIAALGDPEHPLHQRAVDDLVAIGEAAVPALNETLRPHRPWLAAYRAAEALGQIGDGRAAGPLLEALRHPNSNVRWSAVRALASVGDARALLELRRVAREDRGKTSWGEPVAGAAQSALDQMQSRNLLLRGADLIKTAVACVLMLVALIVAYSVISSLRQELGQIGRVTTGAALSPIVSTALPTETAVPTRITEPTAPPDETGLASGVDLTPTAGGEQLLGAVITSGNVRAQPQRGDNVIGAVSEGDEVIFLAASPDGEWFRVRLGERRAAGSRISTDDGTGWVARSLLTEPPAGLPVEAVQAAEEPVEPTAEPTAEPAVEPTAEPEAEPAAEPVEEPAEEPATSP